MKHLLSILAVLFATVAMAAEPKPYLTIDASGQAVVKSGLPAGTLTNYLIVKIGDANALLCITWAENGRGRLAIYNYAFTPYGDPQPDPKPEPQPVPPPPPPVEKIWGLVIVHESKTTTPEQGKAISSKAIGHYLTSKKWHKPWIIDQDVVDENDKPPEIVKAYRERAKSLPWYFIVTEPDSKGNATIVSEGSLPSEQNLFNVLEKIGG